VIPTEIESLLAARLGFDPQTVGPAAVGTAIRQAMEEAGFSDPSGYARSVLADPAAWEALVDRVVVPETSFFRDGTPFELAAEVAWALRQREPERIVRVLSCPCSTGEEPYSLVMALLDGGLPPDSFAVTAVDVSRRAIEATRSGLFRATSFRGADVSYRTRYFDRAEDSAWRLCDLARSRVSVRQGNMLAPLFLVDEAPFDLLFCRNLMIYLHAGAKTTVMTVARRLMASDGTLVVGHAEGAIARDHGFAPVGRAGAFAFGRAAPQKAPQAAPGPHDSRSPGAPPRRRAAPPAAAGPSPETPSASTRPPSVEPESALVRARQLADAGHLPEALRLCSEHLARVPDSAEGHFLMGVLHDAEGRWRLALPAFRKALYLNPSHLGALQHLALKYETSGDQTSAALLRARARRAGDDAGDE
jgi:chemotaxis protein methyltransferase WspC